MKDKAVVLLSGGLDSAVALYSALDKGYECHCLTFDYGQRHRKEIEVSAAVAARSGSRQVVARLDLPWKGSSLVDTALELPSGRTPAEIKDGGVPSTYVPARNTIFLSAAASMAEAIGARAIFIGAHSEDSSGYPDCGKEYLEAFAEVVRLGTKAGIEGNLALRMPLISLDKSGIIKLGLRLGAPLELTWSCYKGSTVPCGTCDSCVLRAKGFREAGVPDPALNSNAVKGADEKANS